MARHWWRRRNQEENGRSYWLAAVEKNTEEQEAKKKRRKGNGGNETTLSFLKNVIADEGENKQVNKRGRMEKTELLAEDNKGWYIKKMNRKKKKIWRNIYEKRKKQEKEGMLADKNITDY